MKKNEDLITAIEANNFALVKKLVDSGADVDAGKYNLTPVTTAIFEKQGLTR